ncbi:uncharacterized protein LOC111398928 isoform X1 [Olea europaea var. sylvestris]|uniref:Uncharacterized protein n=1 Tax=Olea europaea subsp. europaea TaxID=158383 RepID=A0A8S0QY89_OLEEU|nr:uncharacterized protein LOC111398928 isoform X1 [Olea europaea var. sylvestris]CAA2971290.1 Hypothetical predicted protein [Olea europaea subsp. europaea]
MRGISISHSHPRPCSGKKTSRKDRNNGEADNVILIDVDPDHFDNVIIIDVPESLPKKSRGSSLLRKDKKWPFVICIDDDESTDDNCSGIGVNANGSFSNSATCSKKSCFASKEFENAADSAGEECQFVPGNATPVRLSKCKRTYSGKASTRNGYGPSVNSEGDLSGKDSPDCVIMEDSSGELQKQWEKAFFRRKKDKCNGIYDAKGCDDTSRASNENHHQNVTQEIKSRKYEEAPFCSSTSKSSEENEASSPFVTKEDDNFSSTFFKDPTPDDISLQSVLKTHMQYNQPASNERSHSGAEYSPFNFTEQQASQHYDLGSSSCHKKQNQHSPLSHFPCHGHGTKQVNHTTSLEDDEEFMRKHQNSFETNIDHDRSTVRARAEKFQEKVTVSDKDIEHSQTCEPGATSSVKEKENLMSENSSFVHFSSLNDQVKDDATRVGPVSEEAFFCKNSSLDPKNVIDNSKLVPEMPSSCNRHLNETQAREDDSCLDEAAEKLIEPVSNSLRVVERDYSQHTRHGENSQGVETCIINEREKLKETDEYKRAIEEEWASRHRALQIQAEEAQHLRQLRKRQKAESMRLLDMERRQKLRVEEIRETQKKDEENMNLKEAIRTEVRTQLKKLETMCHDMASLLHYLGIKMASWPHPSPHENLHWIGLEELLFLSVQWLSHSNNIFILAKSKQHVHGSYGKFTKYLRSCV